MRTRTLIKLSLVAALTMASFSPAAHSEVCVKAPVGQNVCVDLDNGHGPDPCASNHDPYQGSSDPLCLPGPASCVAVALAVEVEPVPVLLPTGASTQLSRSVADTFAGAQAFTTRGGGAYSFGHAQAHGDAHQARAVLPGTIDAGVLDSKCDAQSVAWAVSFEGEFFDYADMNRAFGRADVTDFSIDLGPNYSIPITIEGDLGCEEGASTDGAPGALFDPCTPPSGDPGATATGANRADILNLVINGTQVSPLTSVGPNTWIPLPPLPSGLLGDLYLNEQDVSFVYGCPTYWGDAARIVLRLPTGPTVATITIGHVATTTCA